MELHIHTTLDEVISKVNDPIAFCEELGFDPIAVKERGGYGVDVTLTIKQARRWGLLDEED